VGPWRPPSWLLLLLLGAVSSAVVVGAFNPAPHTGGDNAGYVALGYSLLHNGSYTEIFDPASAPHTKYPPVFPALLAVLMALGVRTWSGLKAVAAVSTVAVSILSYLWAERRLGRAWALGIALLVTFGSASVYYSHWILSDPTFVALTLLSLWSLDRADASTVGRQWLALGVASAGLAYFTRSAGLPLLLAIGTWLTIGRRWKWLAASVTGLGPLILLWLLRARVAGQGEYVAEFWLVDPYDPGLGRVDLGGLFGRVTTNLIGYVGTHLPAGIVGGRGPAVAALGILVTGLGVLGWTRAIRRGPGPVEFFLPLYAGLLLLWPVVWSGDRFVLPLYPVLFLYSASALSAGARLLDRRAPATFGVAFLLVVLLPEGSTYMAAMGEATECKAMTRVGGAFACWGPRVGAFVDAAGWSGANLPEGAAVLSRKPRLFFALSGVPSRTFPFSDDPEAHTALADALGARYELLDEWDGLATRYVGGAVQQLPGAFCALGAFGDSRRTQLLVVLPPERRTGGRRGDAGGVSIPRCGREYLSGDGTNAYDSGSSRIPLLEGLDP
jgi:4-amino-4-deoxy-L-arabinose transferase-like glycosyltransferase